MNYSDDPEGYRRRLEAKLAPERIRSTLAFSGLYLMIHELIVKAVLEQTKGFFGKSMLDHTWLFGGEHFKESVLSRHKVPFKACLLWLVEMNAITSTQGEQLDDIYRHRNDLAHEPTKFIIDPDFEPDVQLFLDALVTLRAIQRFWVSVEKDVGTFEEYGDIDLDEVTPLSLATLQMCIDAYVGGLPESPES